MQSKWLSWGGTSELKRLAALLCLIIRWVNSFEKTSEAWKTLPYSGISNRGRNRTYVEGDGGKSRNMGLSTRHRWKLVPLLYTLIWCTFIFRTQYIIHSHRQKDLLELILIIPRFHILEFTYSLKFICNPQINAHSVFTVIYKHTHMRRVVNTLSPSAPPCPSSQGEIRGFSSHNINKCAFPSLFITIFSIFLWFFVGDFTV